MKIKGAIIISKNKMCKWEVKIKSVIIKSEIMGVTIRSENKECNHYK